MGMSVVFANHGGAFEDLVRAVRNAPRLVSIACEVPGPRDAFRIVRQCAPDTLLLGMCPRCAKSMHAIRTLTPKLATRVVVMCRPRDAAIGVEALQAGAAGYLFVGTNTDDVVRIFRTIAAVYPPRDLPHTGMNRPRVCSSAL